MTVDLATDAEESIDAPPTEAPLDEEEEQAAALERATAIYTDHQRRFKDFERASLSNYRAQPYD